MKAKMVKRQFNAKDCFVCGLANDSGLKTMYYETENDEVVGIFHGQDLHQSYPNRMHGGVISAAMDEAIGRTILIKNPQMFGVTMELTLKYRKPVPLDCELRIVARLTQDSSRGFEGTGEILLPDNSVAVTGWARYFKQPLEQIVDPATLDEDRLLNVSVPCTKEIDLPESAGNR